MLARTVLRAARAAPRRVSLATTSRAVSSLSSFVSMPPRTEYDIMAAMGCDHHEGALEQIFARLDENGDGVLQPDELRAGFRSTGLDIADDALAKLVASYGDEEGNLQIAGLLDMFSAVKEHRFHSFDEDAAAPDAGVVADAATARHYVFCEIDHFEGAIDAAFNDVDDNGDGVIQPEELLRALEKLDVDVSPAKLDQLFSLYDANGDGVLELVEFATLVANLTTEDCR